MRYNKKCKHLRSKIQKNYSIDSYTAKSIDTVYTCRLKRMPLGGCPEDCRGFEPKR